jgi:4-amino-4-deoxy-L-arabinose transferase-like glycosyltransferase
MNRWSIHSKHYLPYLFLSLMWLLLMWVVNPIGNFPLNDDWAYGKNVYYLSEHGILKFSDWPAMTLISQMLWGSAFCKIFGFSFTVLRFSVLLLGLAGINLMYFFLRKTTENQFVPIFSTVVFALNPLYFSLSYTFMTDVPFLVTILLAFYFNVRYSNSPEKILYLILAFLFTAIAMFIRQTGLILPLTILTGHLLLNLKFTKNTVLQIGSLGLLFTLLYLYIDWLKASQNLSESFSTGAELLQQGSLANFLEKLANRCGILLIYNGLFLLPLLVLVLKTYWLAIEPPHRLLFLLLAVLPTLPVFFIWDDLPVSNLLSRYGLSPKLFKDAYWGMNLRPYLSDTGFLILKIAGTIGAFLLNFLILATIWNFRQIKKQSNAFFIKVIGDKNSFSLKFFSIGMVASFWIFLILGTYFFDRYYLFFLPFFILFLVPSEFKPSSFTRVLAILLVLAYGFFSVAGTHDTLALNRARWKALDKLQASGILPVEIDGGFEFNGWYQTHKRNPHSADGKSWWFVKDDKYIVASGDFCGFRKIDKHFFYSFLSFSRDSVFISQRIDDAKADTLAIFCNAEETACFEEKEYFKTNLTNYFCETGNTRTDSFAKSGNYAAKTDSLNPFAFTLRLDNVLPCERIILGVYTKNNLQNAVIVASSPDARTFYKTETVNDTVDWSTWKYLELEISRPQDMPSELGFYVWHMYGPPVYFDDFTIRRITPDFPQNAEKNKIMPNP